jgi:hypothetical protein
MVVALRIALLGLILIVATVSSIPVLAADLGQGTTLSGFATNALVRAYEASGLDGVESPPFRLQEYFVTIQPRGAVLDIYFLAQTEAVAIPVAVAARTGAIIWKKGDRPDFSTMPDQPGGYVLPGIVAGEIIMAYRAAASEHFPALSTGAYNLWYLPHAGALDVGFSKLTRPPADVSTEPAPTPSAVHNCFSVAMSGPSYTVAVMNNKVSVYDLHITGCG